MTTFTIPILMCTPTFPGDGQIAFIEKPVPVPGVGELLLKVSANAICGSERGQFYAGSQVTPGHEAAGIVAAAGPDTTILPGTHGVVYLMDFCGACPACRLGYTNQCRQKRADMGFSHDGGYGPYELIRERIFFPIDAAISLTEATMLLDILGTGGHAIRRAQLLRSDIESVAIAGAGPIGLGTLAMARLLLGEDIPVYIADVTPFRLALAEQLGGVPVNVSQESFDHAIRRFCSYGADIAIDTSGKTVARQACLSALAQRGVLVCVGHGEGLALEVSPQLIAPERAILGSEYFRFNELPANLTLFRAQQAYFRTIITHRFPVSALAEAFDTFFRGATGKVVVEQ